MPYPPLSDDTRLRIQLTAQDNTVGALRVSVRTAGASFTITSSVDSGVVAYEIFEAG